MWSACRLPLLRFVLFILEGGKREQKGEGRKKEKERDRIFHLLVHSLNSPKSQDCARPTPEVRNSTETFYIRDGAQCLGYHLLPSQAQQRVKAEQPGLKLHSNSGCQCAKWHLNLQHVTQCQFPLF